MRFYFFTNLNWNIQFLFLLITVWIVPTSHQFLTTYNGRNCGTLYSEPKSQGASLSLKDEDIYSDFGADIRIHKGRWSSTGSILVESGCKMEVCNETYLDGDCHVLDHGSHSVEENYFFDGTASAQCTCHKECGCSGIHIKKSSCGRAYFQGGCRNCNALYTELNLDGDKTFPEEFSGQVRAIRLRSGCRLIYYSAEYFKGDNFMAYNEVTKNFQGQIRSYECRCGDVPLVRKSRTPRPESHPEFIDLPESITEIETLFSSNDSLRRHPGVNAALRSYGHGRSSKNAYILVLGSRFAGKSSAIRLLLNNDNVTSINNNGFSVMDIKEIRIPVQISELGIANSELRIIDTPGIGDTRGLEQDAPLLANLDQYLSRHYDLGDRIPNIVLIFHRFNDYRFDDEYFQFIKMIRGLSLLTKRITDEKFSNIVFVLSYVCSGRSGDQRQPKNRLKHFEQVIRRYGRFPRPFHIVLAENKGYEHALPMMNGNYRLPNKEYYPRNLIDKLELITKRGGDAIGRGVFKNAFKDAPELEVSEDVSHPLLSNIGNLERYLNAFSKSTDNVWMEAPSSSFEAELMERIVNLEAQLESLKNVTN